MKKRLIFVLVFVASMAWAQTVRVPECGFWCQMGFAGRDIPRRLMPEIGKYWLPRGVGVIAHGYDMAMAPNAWWPLTNIMPNHAMLDDIAQHDIRIANIWVRVDPFDGTARWCNRQWWPYTGYSGTEMCRGDGTIINEDMDLFWTHPDFDVLVIRFEAWATTEEGCNGGESLVWESEPTKGIVDTLYERYGNQNKIIIFQNWEADWQLHGVGCRDGDECVAFSERQYLDCDMEGLTSEECCSRITENRGRILLRTLNERQMAIYEARQSHMDSALRVYHAVNINFYLDEEFTVAKDIIPQMDMNPDFVGVSHWRKPPVRVTDALGYIEAHTGLPRYRIYVSELGSPERVDRPAYDRIMNESTLAFEWGVPMVLIWHWKYWRDDVRQQRLSLFEADNVTPTSGYWAVRELNDTWR